MTRANYVLLVALAIGACADNTSPSPDLLDDPALAGGAMTVFDATSSAFSTPAPNLTAPRLDEHRAGDAQFEAVFVTAPAPVNGGLGPVFNNVSCRACHVRDGRGRPPEGAEPFASMLIRLSVPGTDAHGGPVAAPGFGRQLQARAVVGATAEADPHVIYDEIPGTYGDGQPFSLRRPHYDLGAPYTTLPAGLLVSPRVAPAVFGLGLLEAVDETEILSRADPQDVDQDGISGRVNRTYDPTTGTTVLGRFGWKAATGSLLAQTVGAYNEDMGVTSSVLSDESCYGQWPGCDPHPLEITDEVTALVAFYVRTLAVPARRRIGDPQTSRGEELFRTIGCTACHAPTLVTGGAPHTPEAAHQTIHPYTDLLLHDMGDGLADHRPDYEATGSEWRTPPLWGLGLLQVVNGHTYLLHDGRARNVAEAILWHGGEGERAKQQFRTLAAVDRAALLAFLGSL
jgi:CxxC motif-containing protein (DUF1111 family)